MFVEGARDAVIGDVRSIFMIAMGTAAFVFLIACANLINLSLARGATRAREFAVRNAMGADRRAIIQQLLAASGIV